MTVACCELILADLEKDAKMCLRAGKDPSDTDAIRKCRIILSKEHLPELLFQLRGQSQAIMLLLTTWRRYQFSVVHLYMSFQLDLVVTKSKCVDMRKTTGTCYGVSPGAS